MSYNIVLFDADMTLLDFDADEKNAFYTVMKNRGLDCNEDIYRLYHKINIGFWQQYEKGIIKKSEIGSGRFGTLAEKLGLTVSGSLLNEEYMQLLSEGGTLLPGAADLCRRLSEYGFSLYIITNGTDFIQNKRLKKSGLAALTDGVFISDVIGHQKPDKEFFQAVLSSINEKDKSKILIVGDSLTSDIKGGINCGIDTCLFAPEAAPLSSEIIPTYTVKSFAELEALLINNRRN